MHHDNTGQYHETVEAHTAAEQATELWLKEIHQDTSALSFRVTKTLFSEKSPYQQIDLVETANHGRILLNDGIVMLTERDEFIYHEMIAHVALFTHPSPKRVLVIGGGDGGTVREVLKHSQIEQTVLVEIDEVVVEACRKYLPSVSCAMNDPRLQLIFDDGLQYVTETNEQFDIVLVDSTDPVGPGVGLFEKRFYENVAGVLTENGIMVTQAESPFYDVTFQQTMFSNQRPYFKKLHMFLYTTLAYVGGLYSFGFASKGLCPLQDFDPKRVKSSGISTRYYNSNIHRAAFMLPVFIEQKLKEICDRLPG
ncbi:MAG: polyamine aminopropyltransferase [Desulfobacterales bacterium]|nr:MAG: polyamine aminopropyltransferase [Desulfobacterales bacterium]